MRKHLRNGFFLFVATMSWYCSGIDNPLEPAPVTEVTISNGRFSPTTARISVGETVRWINNDSEVRTVESGTPMNPTTNFNSPNIQPGAAWERSFSTAGTFPYYSSITGATGSVVVSN